jgi:hypothetical protein
MANVRFKTELPQEVEVIGTYIPETPARTYGPPEDCDPGDPEDMEIEAVLVGHGEHRVNIVGALTDVTLQMLKEQLRDEAQSRMESDLIERQVAAAEARRDSEEDR